MLESFVEIVTDSTQADFIISLVVEKFGYKDKTDIDVLKGWLLGGTLGAWLGLIGHSDHGYAFFSGFAKERSTGGVAHLLGTCFEQADREINPFLRPPYPGWIDPSASTSIACRRDRRSKRANPSCCNRAWHATTVCWLGFEVGRPRLSSKMGSH